MEILFGFWIAISTIGFIAGTLLAIGGFSEIFETNEKKNFKQRKEEAKYIIFGLLTALLCPISSIVWLIIGIYFLYKKLKLIISWAKWEEPKGLDGADTHYNGPEGYR